MLQTALPLFADVVVSPVFWICAVVVAAFVGWAISSAVREWWIGPILDRLDDHSRHLAAIAREARLARDPVSFPWTCSGCGRKGAAGEWTCPKCGAIAP